MSDKNIAIEIIKPFGPSIVRAQIPEHLIKKINEYVDDIVEDKEKSKELSHGHRLAGNVTQEFKLEPEFMKEINWGGFIGNIVAQWLLEESNKKITQFQITSSWIVRQFQNEHNPIHWHGGHISGVGYLKVPKFLDSKKKNFETNGTIDFINGSKMFLNDSIYNHSPKVGDVLLFPNYLMHTAYPFSTRGERRSFSFNVEVDKKIANIFSK